MAIRRGRYTTELDGDFIVFLIGMRINRPWKPQVWLPVLLAMPKMILWLEKRPEEGLLHAELVLRGPLSPTVVQYWRSFEELERFARRPDAPHLAPWKAFNAKIRDSGDVGIFHETYHVAAGAHESMFVNMPERGLAAAGTMTPVGSTAQTAAKRIGARAVDEPPVAPY